MSARRSGLGRGLDALLEREEPSGEEIARDEGVRTLPLDRLQPNRYQPRTLFNDSELEELANSIRTQGVVQPLVVSTPEHGRYTIIAGERRWRAARLAGLETVPVVVRQISGDQELLELALVENLQRADLNVMEEAEAYQTLRNTFDLSQEEIGTRVGKGRSTVTNTLRLLRLPIQVQDLLRQGRLTAGQARPLLSLPQDQQLGLAERASREGLTARKLESLAAARPRTSHPQEPPPSEIHTAIAAETLTKHLQTRVEIKRRHKGGMVQIHFHSEEELMRIYEVLLQNGG